MQLLNLSNTAESIGYFVDRFISAEDGGCEDTQRLCFDSLLVLFSKHRKSFTPKKGRKKCVTWFDFGCY